jgi:hypothetical protein
MARGHLLRDVHRAVAVDARDDDPEVAAPHHRLELRGVPPSDATAMELDRVAVCVRDTLDVSFVSLEAADDSDPHG